ncbi:hypothetical protein ScPMuIL_009442 [Solemya velum]
MTDRVELETFGRDLETPDIIVLEQSKVEPKCIGAYSKTLIKKDTRFGPYVGDIIYERDEKKVDFRFAWEVFDLDTGDLLFIINATKPGTGNWMRYINCARFFEEQNIVSMQDGTEVYYRAMKDIAAGEELLTWFSAIKRKKKRRRKKVPDEKNADFNYGIGAIPQTVTSMISEQRDAGKRKIKKTCRLRDSVEFVELTRKRGNFVETRNNKIEKEMKHDAVAESEKDTADKPKKKRGRKKKAIAEEVEGKKSMDPIHKRETNMPLIVNGVEWQYAEPGTQFHFDIHKAESIFRNGIKVFRCDICDGVYKHVFSLKRHYLRNHVNCRYLTETDVSNSLVNIVQQQTGIANCLGNQTKKDTNVSNKEHDEIDDSSENSNPNLERLFCNESDLDSNSNTTKSVVDVKDEDKCNKSTGTATPPLYWCNLCNLLFDHSIDLREHIKNHPDVSDEKPFACDGCYMRFKYNKNLVRHRRVHITDDNSSIASDSITTKSNLALDDSFDQTPPRSDNVKMNITEKRNTEKKISKKYHCSMCPLVFMKERTLKNHIEKFCVDKPFPCKYCGKRFPLEDNLRRHTLYHTTCIVKCKHCTEVFRHIGELRFHMRSKHPEVQMWIPRKSVDSNEGGADKNEKTGFSKKRRGRNRGYQSKISGKLVLQRSKLGPKLQNTSQFKFVCVVCKKRFSAYVNMCRHRRLAHRTQPVKPEVEEKDDDVFIPPEDLPPIDNSPEALSIFYAGVASNIATNMNSFIDGVQDSLSTFRDHISIGDYESVFKADDEPFTASNITWEQFNFPKNYSHTDFHENLIRYDGKTDYLNCMTDKSNLEAEVKSVLPTDAEIDVNSDNDQRYMCVECGTVCTSADLYSLHLSKCEKVLQRVLGVKICRIDGNSMENEQPIEKAMANIKNCGSETAAERELPKLIPERTSSDHIQGYKFSECVEQRDDMQKETSKNETEGESKCVRVDTILDDSVQNDSSKNDEGSTIVGIPKGINTSIERVENCTQPEVDLINEKEQGVRCSDLSVDDTEQKFLVTMFGSCDEKMETTAVTNEKLNCVQSGASIQLPKCEDDIEIIVFNKCPVDNQTTDNGNNQWDKDDLKSDSTGNNGISETNDCSTAVEVPSGNATISTEVVQSDTCSIDMESDPKMNNGEKPCSSEIQSTEIYETCDGSNTPDELKEPYSSNIGEETTSELQIESTYSLACSKKCSFDFEMGEKEIDPFYDSISGKSTFQSDVKAVPLLHCSEKCDIEVEIEECKNEPYCGPILESRVHGIEASNSLPCCEKCDINIKIEECEKGPLCNNICIEALESFKVPGKSEIDIKEAETELFCTDKNSSESDEEALKCSGTKSIKMEKTEDFTSLLMTCEDSSDSQDNPDKKNCKKSNSKPVWETTERKKCSETNFDGKRTDLHLLLWHAEKGFQKVENRILDCKVKSYPSNQLSAQNADGSDGKTNVCCVQNCLYSSPTGNESKILNKLLLARSESLEHLEDEETLNEDKKVRRIYISQNDLLGAEIQILSPQNSPPQSYESIAFGKNGAVAYVCSVCRRYFKDSGSLLRHQFKKHPSIACHFLEVEQGHDIDYLYYFDPSNIGVLAETQFTVPEHRIETFKCTRCHMAFKNMNRLRIHIINSCAPFTIGTKPENSTMVQKQRRKRMKRKIMDILKGGQNFKFRLKDFSGYDKTEFQQEPKRKCFTGCRSRKVVSVIEPAKPKTVVRQRNFDIGYNPHKHVRRRELTELIESHQCSGCGFKFKSISLLERHVKNCARKEKFKDLKPMKNSLFERKYTVHRHTCYYCSKGFTYPKFLINHYQLFCSVKKEKREKGMLTEEDKKTEEELVNRLKLEDEEKQLRKETVDFEDFCDEQPAERQKRFTKGWPRGLKRRAKRKNHSWTYIKRKKSGSNDDEKRSSDLNDSGDLNEISDLNEVVGDKELSEKVSKSELVKKDETVNVDRSCNQLSGKSLAEEQAPKSTETEPTRRTTKRLIKKKVPFGSSPENPKTETLISTKRKDKKAPKISQLKRKGKKIENKKKESCEISAILNENKETNSFGPEQNKELVEETEKDKNSEESVEENGPMEKRNIKQPRSRKKHLNTSPINISPEKKRHNNTKSSPEEKNVDQSQRKSKQGKESMKKSPVKSRLEKKSSPVKKITTKSPVKKSSPTKKKVLQSPVKSSSGKKLKNNVDQSTVLSSPTKKSLKSPMKSSPRKTNLKQSIVKASPVKKKTKSENLESPNAKRKKKSTESDLENRGKTLALTIEKSSTARTDGRNSDLTGSIFKISKSMESPRKNMSKKQRIDVEEKNALNTPSAESQDWQGSTSASSMEKKAHQKSLGLIETITEYKIQGSDIQRLKTKPVLSVNFATVSRESDSDSESKLVGEDDIAFTKQSAESPKPVGISSKVKNDKVSESFTSHCGIPEKNEFLSPTQLVSTAIDKTEKDKDQDQSPTKSLSKKLNPDVIATSEIENRSSHGQIKTIMPCQSGSSSPKGTTKLLVKSNTPTFLILKKKISSPEKSEHIKKLQIILPKQYMKESENKEMTADSLKNINPVVSTQTSKVVKKLIIGTTDLGNLKKSPKQSGSPKSTYSEKKLGDQKLRLNIATLPRVNKQNQPQTSPNKKQAELSEHVEVGKTLSFFQTAELPNIQTNALQCSSTGITNEIQVLSKEKVIFQLHKLLDALESPEPIDSVTLFTKPSVSTVSDLKYAKCVVVQPQNVTPRGQTTSQSPESDISR